MINWLTVKRFCELSGYTVDAVDQKRSSGVWLQDQVWKKAPDGRILVSIEGYHAWVEGRLSAPQARRIFKSIERARPFVTQLPTETEIDSRRSQKPDQSSRKIRTELKQK